jgi:glucose-6-phosphate 1-dehydrogenase
MMSTTATQPTILVIVGITGDLAQRKLLPAIESIAAAGMLPQQFAVVGISRRESDAQAVLGEDMDRFPYLSKHLSMYRMDLEASEDYHGLAKFLQTVEAGFGASAQRLFYLSVPPQVSRPIINFLGESGLAAGSAVKLLLEKPFGTDLASAEELIAATHRHFDEDRVYRIDHYLAKEMAQNILVFRAGNSLFKRTWNKNFIEKIEIIASETIGIEGRAVFYEQTGALRDLVQSHLLQLAALTLMELPKPDAWQHVPDLRLQALKQLMPPTEHFQRDVHRGQYAGYRDEVLNPHSMVETFVALTLFSKAPQWTGVPITLVTGKALNRKATEIRIHYRQEDAHESNQLTLRIQPQEGIEVCLWTKRPGYERQLEQVPLDLSFAEHYDSLPEAYEQVLVDAIRSDHSLFTSSEEVLAAWRILAPIQETWMSHDTGLTSYPIGSTPDMVMQSTP